MKDLCCISFLGKGNGELLVAGRQDDIYKIDIEQGRVTEKVGRILHYGSGFYELNGCKDRYQPQVHHDEVLPLHLRGYKYWLG